MAQRGQKDLLARLADAGEEALSRLASSPGLERVTGVISNLKDQVDALASRVRGLEALEKRVADLERKVERLSKSSPGSTRARKTTAARKSSSSRKTASRKKT
jgi:hypothetical protein